MKTILDAVKISILFPIVTGMCFLVFIGLKTLDKLVQYSEKSI